MKSIIRKIAAIALLSPAFSQAQEFYGTATYVSSSNTEGLQLTDEDKDKLPEEVRKMLADQVKAAFEKTYILHFDKTTSIYEEVEKTEALPIDPRNNFSFSTVSNAPKEIVYHNLRTNDATSQVEIYDKVFLVQDSLTAAGWEVKKETKVIAGYTCQKATRNEKVNKEKLLKNNHFADFSQLPDERVITAWFTTEIPVSHGPGEYLGLPGLILEAGDGQTVVQCSKIVLNPIDKPEINAPTKGQRVSREKFAEIINKKTAEYMEANNIKGSGSSIRIIDGN